MAALVAAPACFVLPTTCGAQMLQARIDAAAPGDTVDVAAGDYPRPLTMDKAIVLQAVGPAEARLAGLSGSLGTLVGLVFDGGLDPAREVLVEAGSSLHLQGCAFRNGRGGLRVGAGATDVALQDCLFSGLVQGIVLADLPASLILERTQLLDCVLALLGPETPITPPGPGRGPARRCDPGPCGRVEIRDSEFSGGTLPIDLDGPLVLAVTRTTIASAPTALAARGLRVEITNCTFTGGGSGAGLSLNSCSGFVRGSHITGWATGLSVGDAGTVAYSDLSVGGSLASGNDIVGNQAGLRLDQPEWIGADYNFWGSTECALIAPLIHGQAVGIVVSGNRNQIVGCPTPTTPTSWGRIKAGRAGEGTR